MQLSRHYSGCRFRHKEHAEKSARPARMSWIDHGAQATDAMIEIDGLQQV
jgi:hypothetical protein